MSHDGSVEFFWGEGETRFRLAIGELLKLEERFGVGAIVLLDRLTSRQWSLGEAREILRHGLMGAGHGMEASNKLIARWFDVSPMEQGRFALAVLAAGLSGPTDDEPGEVGAETTTTEAGASSLPPSTARAPSSDGRPPKSTPPPSGRSRPPSKAGTKRRAGKTTPRSNL